MKSTVHLISYSSETAISKTQTVDLSTRKVTVKLTLCSVLAEHSFPLSATPILLELAKALSKDPKALHSTKMCIQKSYTFQNILLVVQKILSRVKKIVKKLLCTPAH